MMSSYPLSIYPIYTKPLCEPFFFVILKIERTCAMPTFSHLFAEINIISHYFSQIGNHVCRLNLPLFALQSFLL